MINASSSTTSIDLGFRAIVEDLLRLDGIEVKSGILESDAGITYSDGETLINVAAANEHGLGVPQRSFLASTFIEQEHKWFNRIKLYMNKAARAGISSSVPNKIGHVVNSSIKRKIAIIKTPPSAARTIAKKRASGARRPDKPLMDTYKLYRSINYSVSRSGSLISHHIK